MSDNRKPVFWTEEKTAAAVAARTPQERRAVASEIGTTPRAVYQQGLRYRRMTGDVREAHQWTPEEDAMVLSAETHQELRAVSEATGQPLGKVRRRRLTIRAKTGEASPRHTWTSEELRLLRSENASSSTVPAWAEARGLPVSTAVQYYSRRGWV